MRICYLPIFLAVTASLMLGSSAQHIRIVRQLDGSYLPDMATMMSTIMSMMVPSEVMSMFTDSFQQAFSKVPIDFAALNSLATLGRKRRSVYPFSRQVESVQNELKQSERSLGELVIAPSSQGVNSAEGPAFRSQFASTETPGANEEFFPRYKRSSGDENKEEGSSDMGAKALEGAMKGAEMAGNGMEGAKMGAKAGSDMAQGGKAGADAAGNGAEMLGKGAEVFAAGAEKGQEMAGGFGG